MVEWAQIRIFFCFCFFLGDIYTLGDVVFFLYRSYIVSIGKVKGN